MTRLIDLTTPNTIQILNGDSNIGHLFSGPDVATVIRLPGGNEFTVFPQKVIETVPEPLVPPNQMIPNEKFKPTVRNGRSYLAGNTFRSAYAQVQEDGGTFKDLCALLPFAAQPTIRAHVTHLKHVVGKKFRPLRSQR